MSSAKRSRGPPNPGNEPTEELGYPALVQYTFVPSDTESSELLVSEGDIVQLVYKVGGWVFVRTYNGKVGYIPFSFCKELESSKEVGSTYSKPGFKRNSVDISEFTNSSDSLSVLNVTPNIKDKSKQIRRSYSTGDKSTRESLKSQTRPEKRVHFADQPKSRNSCDICRNFLTSFNSIGHNTTNVGQKKVNLKPHKLLKLLQTISKDGLVNFGNWRPDSNAQSVIGQITDNRINRRVNSSDFPIKFGNFCNQCDVLKDIFKNTNRYSMSDLYSTIRNLHSHALVDSDSEQEDSESNDVVENKSGHMQNGGPIISSAENIPKRSISFKDSDIKQKVEIVRNNSFSGVMGSERNDIVNISVSPSDDKRGTSDSINANITAVTCTRGAKHTQINNVVGNVPLNPEIRNHKINNYFPENSQTSIGPPITNGFEEDMTDFRSAEYQPPLFNKWRHVNGSLSPEVMTQRPPGIVREQTFEYESLKSRNKEVNFNDPRKENLNLTSVRESNHDSSTTEIPIQNFSKDSRRKPIVSNGDLLLDDGEVFHQKSQEHSLSNGTGNNSGMITKCFTTYEHLGGFHSGANAGRSMTLDRNFKHSSQFSNSENFDNVQQERNHENAYQVYDKSYPKQTETDSAIDRRKIVARKVNPVTSPRNLMTASGPLMGRKNDKDIRKSLLEHSAMKKTMCNPSEPIRTQPVRAQPMRAQHDIANHNETALTSNRTVLVKKFNKQMWRPSLAGSEGSDQRPFSPFGGTLPPSKIVKKKVVEVFV